MVPLFFLEAPLDNCCILVVYFGALFWHFLFIILSALLKKIQILKIKKNLKKKKKKKKTFSFTSFQL